MAITKRVTRAAKRASLASKPKLGLMDMPDEILRNIISLIPRPFEHLDFARVCARICRLYTPRIYQDLCCSYGFGRPLDHKDKKWRVWFGGVVYHMRVCDIKTCVQKGVALPEQRRRLFYDWSHIPRQETNVHKYLYSLGNVRLSTWMEGFFADDYRGYVQELDTSDGGYFDTDRVEGIDWFADTGIKLCGSRKERLGDHPLLESAFATVPPAPWMRVRFNEMGTLDVHNPDGVTVGDFHHTVQKWLCSKPDMADYWAVAEFWQEPLEEALARYGDFSKRLTMVCEITEDKMGMYENDLTAETFLNDFKEGDICPMAYFFTVIEDKEESS